MKKILIIVSLLLLSILIIYVIRKNILVEDDTVMIDSAKEIEQNELVTQELDDEIDHDFEAVWFLDLLQYMSKRELQSLINDLEELYMNYLPKLVKENINVVSYFDENSEEIKLMCGLQSMDDFSQLYDKLVLINEYQKCQVFLKYDTIIEGEDKYYFDLKAVFDETTEVDFYVSIDRQTLEMQIY